MIMKNVKITKLAAVNNAKYQPASWDDYEIGEINSNVSIPVDYWIEGYLHDELKVGAPAIVSRYSRNGVKSSGVFTTSLVVKITEQGFETLNSVYIMDYIT